MNVFRSGSITPMVVLGVLILLPGAIFAQDWVWGPNAPKPPGNLSSKLTSRLLLGLSSPAVDRDGVILYGGLCPESGRHDLGGSNSTWWIWCGVEPDGTISGIALSDRRPSKGVLDVHSFVRSDPGTLIDMPVLHRKGNAIDKRRKMRLITHVLDDKGSWQEISSNRTENLAKRDNEQFRKVVLDLLDLDD